MDMQLHLGMSLQSDIGGSVYRTLFHKNSKMQVLYTNLRIKVCKMGTVTADFANDIYLNSAFYSFIHPLLHRFYEFYNFIDN